MSLLITPFGLAARVRDWAIVIPDAYILLETVGDLLNRSNLMLLPNLAGLMSWTSSMQSDETYEDQISFTSPSTPSEARTAATLEYGTQKVQA